MKKTIYIDWNVINHFADSVLPVEIKNYLTNFRDSKDYLIPYTKEHVIELLRGIEIENNIEKRIDDLINEIQVLSNNVYWWIDSNNKDHFEIINPKTIMSDIIDQVTYDKSNIIKLQNKFKKYLKIVDKALILMSNASGISKDELFKKKDKFDPNNPNKSFESVGLKLSKANDLASKAAFKKFGFIPDKLNNISEKEIFQELESKYKTIISDFSINGLIEKSEKIMNSSSIYNSSALNGFLQQSGYFKDKDSVSEESKKSDSIHIFFGFRASVFITHDKRLYKRALSIKEILKSDTKIIWATDVIKDLSTDL